MRDTSKYKLHMKKYVIIPFILLSISILSQTKEPLKNNTVTITGKILDFKTKQTLPYVNISCKNSKNDILSGGITTNKGTFSVVNLPIDSIFIDIQFIGYKTLTSSVLPTKENRKINLGTLFLKEDTTNLDEVVIQAETAIITQKIDRKVVNVNKDLASAGTNSLQMLENIPSISVNFQTGSINLRGNENVRVLVDGKPSNLSASQLLKQIPSSSVKSVEIITNPSAKYNPEGMSGIINVILKKNTTIGFNGSFSVGVEHSKNARPTGSLDLNYRTGSVNFYGNYSIDWGKFETNAFFDRIDKDLTQTID
jgi:hypothetical protein